MDLGELRKMPLPKLRERAKEVTDLKGVIGMKKEELIEAIAKAEGLSYETPRKDVSTISSIKAEIRSLAKKKGDILTSSRDRCQLERVRRMKKRLKRMTRKLAREALARQASQQSPAPEPAPAGPASESSPTASS